MSTNMPRPPQGVLYNRSANAVTYSNGQSPGSQTQSTPSLPSGSPASGIVGKQPTSADYIPHSADGGSTTSSTTDTTTAKLQETSVLADSYIPNHLRSINLHHVSIRIQSHKLPTLERELETIFHSCVPPSQCLCPQRHTTFRRIHTQAPEIWFALSQPPEHMEKRNSLPLVSNISNLGDYVQTFKTLLHRERRETLILFERYSQYEHKLGNINDSQTTTSPKSPTAASTIIAAHQPQEQDIASFCIPGISDANPAIEPGDTVLLRPMTLVALPLAQDYNRFVWSQAVHSIEIQAQVMQVIRSKDGRSDRVMTTWLSKHDQKHFLTSYPRSEFNIRFVPSPKSYNRCLTALDWCNSLPPAVAMNLLLFPNRAPALPSTNTIQLSPESILDEEDDISSLNKAQMQFVDMVLRRTQHPDEELVRPPMILTGPAGTGKTKTLLAAIKQVLKLPETTRILVCAPSHTAANVITRRLAESLPRTDQQKIFRLLDSDRPVATVPAAILPYCRQNTTTGAFTLPVHQILQFSVIVCTCSDAHLLFKAGVTNAQLRDRRRCFRQWMERVLTNTNLSTNGPLQGVDEPHFSHLFIDEASQATEPETLICLSVVVDTTPIDATATGATTTSTNDSMTEDQKLRPRRRPCEIALVGDPRQLNPKVYSQAAAACGLGHAWMERLLQRPIPALGGGHPHLLGPNLATMNDFVQDSFQSLHNNNLSAFLTMNYRCHPSFLMMPSALFYFDKLQSARGFGEQQDESVEGKKSLSRHSGHEVATNTPTWHGKLQQVLEGLSDLIDITGSTAIHNNLPPLIRDSEKKSWPIHFRGVHGKDTSVTIDLFCGTNSWSNGPEAMAVVDIAVALCEQGVSSEALGVMAPFRGQVVLIRKLLRERNLSGVNVGTIEDYQAVEREIVILSLTRSNQKFVSHDVESRVGVFRQPKRTNVAMTRAQNIFIVVGDPSIMSKDMIWRQWLWFCLRNGLWYGEGKEVIDDCFRESKNRQIVKHLPTFAGSNFYLAHGKQNQQVENEETKDDVIVMSTLEEICTRDN